MPHHHLTPSDRVTIESLLVNHFGVVHIANQLNRPVCTIRREIARNAGPSGRYSAVNAQRKYLGRREACRPCCKLSNPRLEQHVVNRLEEEWSPEQIAGRLPIELSDDASMRVSHETIYAYIYREKRNGGTLYKKLRQSHIQRRKRTNSKTNRGIIKDRVLIHKRPAAVDKQSRFGDWEGDSVIGKNHKGAIATFVERKSLYTVAALMKDKCASSMCKAARNAFRRIPKRLRRTLTVDNGKEFTDFKYIQHAVGIDVYFAEPYRSCQRAINENTNGLIRQYLPKKTDFSALNDQILNRCIQKLNNRPRKKLHYRTPREVFLAACGAFRL